MRVSYRDNNGEQRTGPRVRDLLDKLLSGSREDWENGAGSEALIASSEIGEVWLIFAFAGGAGFQVKFWPPDAAPVVAISRNARQTGKLVVTWSGGNPWKISVDQCVDRKEAHEIADHFIKTGHAHPGFQWEPSQDLDDRQ